MIELKRIQQRLISAWVTLSSRDIVAALSPDRKMRSFAVAFATRSPYD